MSVLAIDPGLTCGWCRSDGTNGIIELAGYTDRGEAVAVFQRWLSDQFAMNPTMYLCVERPFFVRMSALADFTYGLCWAAHAVASIYEVPRFEMTADAVRKHVIGRCRRMHGENHKAFDRVILAAVQERGFFPASEHSADAAALLCACEDLQKREVA